MIVRIKRQKYFSDNYNNQDPNQNQKKKGMGTGTKILLGTAAATAATAAGIYGAKRGVFGPKAQKSIIRLGRESDGLFHRYIVRDGPAVYWNGDDIEFY